LPLPKLVATSRGLSLHFLETVAMTCAFFGFDLVEAEEHRPFGGNPVTIGWCSFTISGVNPSGTSMRSSYGSIFDWQHFLDGRPAETGAGIDPLEGQIAARH